MYSPSPKVLVKPENAAKIAGNDHFRCPQNHTYPLNSEVIFAIRLKLNMKFLNYTPIVVW